MDREHRTGGARKDTCCWALTTSSMTGSGLAASSCSFTFSSTRGHKTTAQAAQEGVAP